MFIMLYTYVWKSYLVPVWHAYYYYDIPHSSEYDAIGYVVAFLPILFYRGIKKASSWMSLLLYYFGYVPIILALLFNYPENNDFHVTEYWVVLCIAMSSYFLVDRSTYKMHHGKGKIPLRWIWIFFVFSMIVLVIANRSEMRLVGLADVYDVRLQERQYSNAFLAYLSAWAGTFTVPFVYCYGILKKNKKMIIAGIIGFVLLYMMFALKSQIFAPVILYALYKFFEYQKKNPVGLPAIFSIGLTVVSLFLLGNLENDTVYLFSSIFFMRTLSISGCLFAGWYLPFFQNHPHTYFTHVNIIGAITGANPYHGQSIGTVVSEGGMNANAIFWAMDGVTAMGVWGVAIVSVIFFVFLWLLNAMTDERNLTFVCILMIMPMLALLNNSVFTFLLSNGGILVLLALRWFNLDSTFETTGSKFKTKQGYLYKNKLL